MEQQPTAVTDKPLLPRDALESLRSEATRLRQNVAILLAVKVERLRFYALKVVLLGVAFILGLVGFCALVATAVVLTASGLARGIAAALPGSSWLPEVATGALLLLVSGIVLFALCRRTRSHLFRTALRRLERHKRARGKAVRMNTRDYAETKS